MTGEAEPYTDDELDKIRSLFAEASDSHATKRWLATVDELTERTWPEQHPPRQDSLMDQLDDLHRLAAKLGMYDAADWLWKQAPR